MRSACIDFGIGRLRQQGRQDQAYRRCALAQSDRGASGHRRRRAGAGAPALPDVTPPQANSLWRTGSRSFFRDPRAQKVGDLITVEIDIGDKAKIANTTTRTTTASEKANAANLLGLESRLKGI